MMQAQIILMKFQKNLRNNKKIKYFSQNFFSLPKSINFSIKNSSSPWITKIDADDLIEPFFLKNFLIMLIKII